MAEYMTWPATDGPSTHDTDSPINLGTEFVCTGQTWAKGLRVWRGTTGIGGPLTGRLYEVTSGSTGDPVPGTDVTFTLTGTGWLRADFTTPVELVSGGSYKAVVNFPAGFTGTGGYWSTGPGSGGIVNGPLTTPDTVGSSGGQGTFGYGSTLGYPTGTFNGGNYWVDVVVVDSLDEQQHAERDVTASLELASTVEVVKRAERDGGAPLALAATAGVMAVRSAPVAATLTLNSGGAHVAHRSIDVTAALTLVTSSTQSPGGALFDIRVEQLPTRLLVAQIPSRWTVEAI